MTIEQAVKKLIALHACAEQSEKIKGDPLVWAINQLHAEINRNNKMKGKD